MITPPEEDPPTTPPTVIYIYPPAPEKGPNKWFSDVLLPSLLAMSALVLGDPSTSQENTISSSGGSLPEVCESYYEEVLDMANYAPETLRLIQDPREDRCGQVHDVLPSLELPPAEDTESSEEVSDDPVESSTPE